MKKTKRDKFKYNVGALAPRTTLEYARENMARYLKYYLQKLSMLVRIQYLCGF